MPNPRFLKIAKRWMNKNLPPEKKQAEKQKIPIRSKLERDSEGKPKITLSELEKTVVNTPTQEDYWNLTRVYECGGWRWFLGDLPTKVNRWDDCEEETCIDIKNEFAYSDKKYHQERGFEIISTQKFYNLQNITQENIDEINQWFKYGK